VTDVKILTDVLQRCHDVLTEKSPEEIIAAQAAEIERLKHLLNSDGGMQTGKLPEWAAYNHPAQKAFRVTAAKIIAERDRLKAALEAAPHKDLRHDWLTVDYPKWYDTTRAEALKS
jgi:hypothetical protein